MEYSQRGGYDLEPYDRFCQDVERCLACPLAKTRRQVVICRGNAEAELAFVGEAPGRNEDEEGEAFVGRAGQLLDDMCYMLRLNMDEDAYLFNILKCFTGDVRVSASDLERVYRRRYDGPLVDIQVGSHRLTGTPNHPVMTPQGWVALGALVEGDDVVCGLPRKRVSLSDPHVDHQPVPLAEVFDAAHKAGICQRVVGSYMDFHGDGLETEIEVVLVDSLLRDRLHSAPSQQVEQTLLERSFECAASLQTLRASMQPLLHRTPLSLPAAYCRVGCCCQALPTLGTGALQAQPHGFRAPSQRDPHLSKPLAKPAISYPRLTRKRLESLTSKVTISKVTKVHRRAFAGHVFTLQTSEGWYSANGVIVANCRPPDNEFPKQGVVKQCLPFLDRQLELIAPRVVILTGAQAARYTVWRAYPSAPKMEDLQGRWIWSQRYPTIDFLAMYHPAYLLRLEDDDPNAYEREYERGLDVIEWGLDLLEGKKPPVEPLIVGSQVLIERARERERDQRGRQHE